ncbi:MAG: AAA family ATPase [Smithella sp.]
MYRKFFGLKEKPFEITPDPLFIYLSEKHAEALSHLKYAIREGKGFSVITGEAGTGKTTLVKLLLNTVGAQIRTAYIFNPILDQADFLNYICDDLGIESGAVKSRGQSLTALHNFLLDCFAKDEKVFLIIDEAQSLKPDLLQEVRLLTNLETSKSKLLHVILLGQPELNKTLDEPRFRPLKQRITVRYHLPPLDRTETKDYIIHRLKKAGSRNIAIFNKAALDKIYKYSNGIPRVINIVCDNALLTAFAQGTHQIDKKMIREVIGELENSGRNWKWGIIWAMVLLGLILGAGYFFIFSGMI